MEELQVSLSYEDAELIRKQANRCRDILRSMGRVGKIDKHLHTAQSAKLFVKLLNHIRNVVLRSKAILPLKVALSWRNLSYSGNQRSFMDCVI